MTPTKTPTTPAANTTTTPAATTTPPPRKDVPIRVALDWLGFDDATPQRPPRKVDAAQQATSPATSGLVVKNK